MNAYWGMLKSLSLVHAAIIAVITIGLALFFVQRGLINTILWVVGLAALAVGVVNKASYS